MAILNVNPTRMSLLNLRKQLKTAQRGHKLLKDKRDGLMKHFMAIIREARDLRLSIESSMGNCFSRFLQSTLTSDPKAIASALAFPEASIELDIETKTVMSVPIPSFTASVQGKVRNYGYVQTTGDLDEGLSELESLLPSLLQLAELEKSAENLADEIEKTRRRVNALEYNMIPNYEETIKFIKMKLGEQERATIITTMKVKAQMAEQEKASR